jgi:hypothetical protein
MSSIVVISVWLVARLRAWRSPASRTDCGTLIAGLLWDSLATEFTATARVMKVAVRSPAYRSYLVARALRGPNFPASSV